MDLIKLNSSDESLEFLADVYFRPHIWASLDDEERTFLGVLRFIDKIRCGLIHLYVPVTDDGVPLGFGGGFMLGEGTLEGQVVMLRKVSPKQTVKACRAIEQRLKEELNAKVVQVRIARDNRASHILGLRSKYVEYDRDDKYYYMKKDIR